MTHLTIVLDDELEITRILDKALREEGFEVICCHSMQSFKEKFEENAADLTFVRSFRSMSSPPPAMPRLSMPPCNVSIDAVNSAYRRVT